MLLSPGGRETAISGRVEREMDDPGVVEEKFAIDKVEGSKDKVEVEENTENSVEERLV
jgi:hypothetical protein